MTKEEFKRRWDSDEDGGGLTYEDIYKCAVEWGLYLFPRTHNIFEVRRRVLEAANCK